MSNTGPDLATGDGPYPIDGKIVERVNIRI